jgi:transcriptional regulator with XRE-family HTH domain
LKLDYQKIILNLRNAGLTYQSIANKCGIDAQNIGHYARYEAYEPKFSKAMALLDLHYDMCPDKHNLKELSYIK